MSTQYLVNFIPKKQQDINDIPSDTIYGSAFNAMNGYDNNRKAPMAETPQSPTRGHYSSYSDALDSFNDIE